MTSYQLIGSIDPVNDGATKDSFDNEIPNLVTYLNNFASNNNYDIEFYDNIWDYPNLSGSEDSKKEYALAVDKYLNDQTVMVKDDIILCPYTVSAWGYGQHYYIEEHGPGIHYCLVCTGTGTVPWETRGFVWHETGHALRARHGMGDYSLNSNDEMYDITPMCMAYLQNDDYDPDTVAAAKDDDTFYFCDGKGDGVYDFKHGRATTSARRKNHDINRYGSCTKEKIKDWMDDHV